jgi:hypothetical protein
VFFNSWSSFHRLAYKHAWEGSASFGITIPTDYLCFWQSSSDGVSKSLEPQQGRSSSQVDGNSGTLIKEEKNDHLPSPSQSALSRDNSVCNNGNRYFPGKNGEKNHLQEQKLGTVTQQKEE